MIRASLRRPVAVAMAYTAVALLGMFAWRNIPVEKSRASTRRPIWANRGVFLPVPQPTSRHSSWRRLVGWARVTVASRSRV